MNENIYNTDIRPDTTVTPFPESISSLVWSPVNNLVFATSSWAGQIRIFEIIQSQTGTAVTQRLTYQFPQPQPRPIMKICWNDQGTQLFAGLMDGSIHAYDLGSQQVLQLFKQPTPVSSLHYLTGHNAILSTGYEPSIRIWQTGANDPVANINAQNKVFTSDLQFPLLLAGTANEKILLTDLTNQSTRCLADSADLGKNSQIQSVAFNSKGTMIGVASFDGRASIATVNKSLQGNLNFKTTITFKSNKQELNGSTILYPVNSISFNPSSQRWLMTAGSDGCINLWDYQAKNKIKSLSYGGIPICSAKLNSTGNMIAYALGNDWHLGEEGKKWETKIGVHLITDQETRYVSGSK